MLTIRLEGPFGRWSKMVAASTCFRAVGPSIRNGPTDHEVALFRAGRWHRTSSSGSLLVLTGPFFAVVIDGPTSISFQDARGQSHDLGQFSQVRIDQGEIHARDSADQVVAHLDETVGQWQTSGDEQHWPIIVFSQNSQRAAKMNGANGNSAGHSA